jgi:hypothetical protein
LLVAGMVGFVGLSTGIAQHGDSRLTAPVGREVPAETSHARCCTRVLRWLVGARRAWPTGPERWIPSTRNGRYRGMRRKKFSECAVLCRYGRTNFFGPSTPDEPCAISDQPAESTGPRLGAGFQDAAHEARGRSSPASLDLVDVCPSGRRGRAAWSLPCGWPWHLGSAAEDGRAAAARRTPLEVVWKIITGSSSMAAKRGRDHAPTDLSARRRTEHRRQARLLPGAGRPTAAAR